MLVNGAGEGALDTLFVAWLGHGHQFCSRAEAQPIYGCDDPIVWKSCNN